MVARFFGSRSESPRILVAQRKAESHHAEILNLPSKILDPIQADSKKAPNMLDFSGLGKHPL